MKNEKSNYIKRKQTIKEFLDRQMAEQKAKNNSEFMEKKKY
jgi:hypothetical protein